jgi:L-fuculose-phosphate aldolase
MILSDAETIEDLISISRRAASLGYVAAAEGNTSARSSSGSTFWIKRSGCSLGQVSSDDFVEIDTGRALEDLERASEAVLRRADDRYRASIEVGMHGAIYSAQKHVNFVVHTHSPSSLAGCCTENVREFFVPQFPDSVVTLGAPERNWIFLPYAPPGAGIARLLTKALEDLPSDLRVVILAKHGPITVGQKAAEAMGRTEILEKASYVRLMSQMTGGATSLTAEDAAHLEAMEAEKYRQRVLKGDI